MEQFQGEVKSIYNLKNEEMKEIDQKYSKYLKDDAKRKFAPIFLEKELDNRKSEINEAVKKANQRLDLTVENLRDRLIKT